MLYLQALLGHESIPLRCWGVMIAIDKVEQSEGKLVETCPCLYHVLHGGF